jgi:hypothetical protein
VARFRTTVESTMPPEAAFDYLAEFSNAREWDPGVVEATNVTGHPVGLGSRFRLVSRFLGRSVPLEYRVTAFDRPSRVVLTAAEEKVRSVDEIRFVPTERGTRVTYDADLRVTTPLGRLLDPLLAVVFRRIGTRAAAGLRRALVP